MDAKLDQLQRLGELKSQGVLSEAEFQAQKQRILGS
jgi:Short C-terminal domain